MRTLIRAILAIISVAIAPARWYEQHVKDHPDEKGPTWLYDEHP